MGIQEEWISSHNHTIYSKLDCMNNPEELIIQAKKLGMKALAITDHGVVGGIVKFFNAGLKHGVKPIIGVEIYLTEDSTIKSRKEMEDKSYKVYHLILLAKNDVGLSNLYKICSYAGNNGLFDDYERIDLDFIVNNNLGEGIICTSACMGGPLGKCITDKLGARTQDAINWAIKLNGTFEHFYIELTMLELPGQLLLNRELINIANALHIPITLAGDTHYINKDDAKVHDILLAINTGSMVDNPDRFKFPSNEFYLRSPQEAYDYCINHNIPLEAITNTVEIADMCNVDIRPKDKKGLLPPFIVPKGYTEDTYLYKLCYDALLDLARSKRIDYVAYASRLSYELDIISSKGYSGYFLILWDVIGFCARHSSIWTTEFSAYWIARGYTDNPIMVGPGRGSSAGAITAYLLKITKLDPIKYGLFFERFLDQDKTAFPDCDTDFEFLRRQEVIDYILYKYGMENVAQIITFGSIKLKSGARRIMKALKYSNEEQTEVANSVPEKMPDQSDPDYKTLKDILADPNKYKDKYGERKFKPIYNKVVMFWDFMNKYPEVSEALEKLEGCIANYGIHPSGVIIAPPDKLFGGIPTKRFDSAQLPVSQIDMEDIDTIMALKLDVLGLKTLSIIDIACKLAGIDKNILDTEDYDGSPEIYKMLRNGLTSQVFQVSSSGMTKMIADIKLENFCELGDALALYRPGPLEATDDKTGLTMVESYIANKKNNVRTSIHPSIDTVLSPTQGVMVYQEQIMRVSQIVAGYTLGQSDARIRKPIGKKLIAKFPAIRQEFVHGSADVPGAIARGYTEHFANSLFDMIVKFAGYAFNRSHSYCYADIAWKTAYLKLHYPAEYMSAVMTVHYNDLDEIVECLIECKKMGIDVLPPNINESMPEFTIKRHASGKCSIVYGLTAIKGIGLQAAQEVINYRPYVSFDDFMTKIHDPDIKRTDSIGKKINNPLNKRNEPILIYAGCFDILEEDRHKLINEYMTIRKEKDYQPLIAKFTRLLRLEYEKQHLGIYVSDHPLKDFPYVRWSEIYDGEELEIGGIIREVKAKPDKNGRYFATGFIETIEDKRKFIVGSSIYGKLKDKLIVGKAVVMSGMKNTDYENISVTHIAFTARVKNVYANCSPQDANSFIVSSEEVG